MIQRESDPPFSSRQVTWCRSSTASGSRRIPATSWSSTGSAQSSTGGSCDSWRTRTWLYVPTSPPPTSTWSTFKHTHTHTPLSLPLTPSLTLRGLPPGCLAGWLKIRKPLSAGRIWGDSLPLPSQPTSSQLTSCRVTAKSSLHTHVHTHTHTYTYTHTLPLRPHCSVRPPASEMTIAIVAVHEEAAPHHHRLIVICCFNDSWWLYHSRYTSVNYPVLLLITNQTYFLSQNKQTKKKSLLDRVSSEYFGN